MVPEPEEEPVTWLGGPSSSSVARTQSGGVKTIFLRNGCWNHRGRLVGSAGTDPAVISAGP